MTPAASQWDGSWLAPAKLNLCLRILGRREDGYHRLQTAFQLIDLCDVLGFKPGQPGQVMLTGGVAGLAVEDDLSVRAARLLMEHTGVDRGVEITLEKRIPIGGGLGGGSSDAATTILALNHCWGLGLSIDTLASLGLQLGADVPLFVRGHSAWAEELGEVLTPHAWPARWYLVIDPGVQVSTREIFEAPALTRNSPPITIRSFLQDGGGNDCEIVVRKRHPAVGEALDWLGQFGSAQLTGTGACVFMASEQHETAAKCMEKVPPRWQGWLVKGLDRSPLIDRLARA